MKKYTIFLASGLLILFGPMLLEIFIKLPDFLNGFAKGLGLTLIVGSFIVKMKAKKANSASGQV